MQILTGFVLAAAVSAGAYFARSLTLSGALAALALGTLVFGLGGLPWAVLLLAFFITSSLLSHLLKQRKVKTEETFAKSSRRDGWQVAANGAAPGLAVLAHLLFPGSYWPWLVFAGALAAVNADTWATEIGILGSGSPRLITSFKKVEGGTSGAISLPGTLAAAAGAGLIGLLGALMWQGETRLIFPSDTILAILGITSAGLAGSLVDSFLGATAQALYYCPSCQKETEKHPLHGCGTRTELRRGLTWLNNDAVNTACSLSGAVIAAAVGLMLISPVTLSRGEYPMADIKITSTAFQNGAAIPVKFSCTGENRSPVLMWSGLPERTQSLALIVEDPDAPMGTFIHWVIYNMTPTLEGLPEGMPKTDEVAEVGTQGLNGSGKHGYDGPCPPPGATHHYHFQLYALDVPPNLPVKLDSSGLKKAMRGHILAQGELVGTFKR
jgi:Raf kinase inhibitor-like YbhB/YbcL family protein/uncharacterized protein (TIGR00297 family)